ncbi:MAG: alpha/beta hydrolase, partial [Deltaproteobacteria bacterium]
MELHSVTLHGHRVGLRLAGEGPVLLLVHGMASSSAAWTPAGSLLAGPKPAGDYSLGAHATLLRDLLLVLGYEQATVVGHSFGGGVAMQFAYQFPELCERLVLVGSGGLGREVNLLLRALALPGAGHVLRLFCRASLDDAARTLVGWARRVGLGPTPAGEEIGRGYSSLIDAHSRAAFLRTLRAVVGFDGQRVSANARLQLAADLPTLIVWGARDPIIPVDHARRAHAAIAGS